MLKTRIVGAIALVGLCGTPVFAEDFGPDTAAHFTISGAAGFAASAVLTDATDLKPWTRRFIASGIAAAPGFAKEFGMDKKPSMADITANLTAIFIFVPLGEKFAVWAHPRPMTRTEELQKLLIGGRP